MKNIWGELPKPVMVLAPMEGVTDTVFRRVLLRVGRPDVMLSEFTAVEQLFSPGYKALSQNLEYVEEERPLVAQLWGYTPELVEAGARLVADLGYDGVDVNMGCPDRRVVRKGGGSGAIRDKQLAKKIVLAVKAGVEGRIPVSVKTRLGFDRVVYKEWLPWLMDLGIAALAVHGRTAKQLSHGEADWEAIGEIVKLRDQMGVETLVLGNGDVMSVMEARQKAKQYGVDGVMLGRAVLGNPWVFAETDEGQHRSKSERLDLLDYHWQLWEQVWGEEKSYDRLKRFYKVYVKGFAGAEGLRERLMETVTVEGARRVIVENGG